MKGLRRRKTGRQKSQRRPATPGFTTPFRQLGFTTHQEMEESQTSVHAKLLEIQLTEAVRKQVGGKKLHEDPSAYADRISSNNCTAESGCRYKASANLHWSAYLGGGIRENEESNGYRRHIQRMGKKNPH